MKKVEPTDAERDRFERDCLDYALAWRCVDCVHCDATRGRCSLEYPVSDLMNAASFDTPQGTYAFCKHFELI